jgi:hypothetical protein
MVRRTRESSGWLAWSACVVAYAASFIHRTSAYLTDGGGDVDVETIRYELADYIVHSLLAMDDHRHLATSWTAMLKALQNCNSSGASEGDTVKQRVIAHMLVCAAELEASSSSAETFFKVSGIDQAIIELEADKAKRLEVSKKKSTKKGSVSQLDDFTDALAGALPKLLRSLKGDSYLLRQLSRLPRHFRINAFNLPNQKRDFMSLLNTASDLFLELTDAETMSNCALILTSMAKASHGRAGESMLQLKRVACSLRDRMLELIATKRQLKAAFGKPSEFCDVENAKSLCLHRLAILAKQWDLADLLDDGSSDDDCDVAIRRLCTHVARDVEQELTCRVVKTDGLDDATEAESRQTQPQIPEVWDFEDDRLHLFVSANIKQAFDLLYMAFYWRFRKELDRIQEEEGDENGDDIDDQHVLVIVRDLLVKLMLLCFEQAVDVEYFGHDTFSEAHISFATNVQLYAHGAVADLNMLLPIWMHRAKIPLLRTISDYDRGSLLKGAATGFVESMRDAVSKDCHHRW